jgi:hypothetical protein
VGPIITNITSNTAQARTPDPESQEPHMPEPRYYATIRNETLHGSLKWLSECYCEIRDESGEGCSTFRPVNVYIAGTTDCIGHISYNGRVWDQPLCNGLSVPVCLDDSKMIYDNRRAA